MASTAAATQIVPPVAAPTADVDCSGLHGYSSGPQAYPDPKCVAQSTALARPGYAATLCHEFEDSPAVLKAKVAHLAALITASRAMCLYTGAGISTASGIRDYASRASKSVALANASAAGAAGSRLALKPTVTHHVIAALERAGHVANWVNQNHDGLGQKAGFPYEKLNEIHGSWFDPRHNPVVVMDGDLRADLLGWMRHWAAQADLVIAMGSSLTTRMTADEVPTGVAQRHQSTGAGAGLVIINLQRTGMDNQCALRINGRTDVVMPMLAKALGVVVKPAEYDPWKPLQFTLAQKRLLKQAINGQAAFP